MQELGNRHCGSAHKVGFTSRRSVGGERIGIERDVRNDLIRITSGRVQVLATAIRGVAFSRKWRFGAKDSA